VTAYIGESTIADALRAIQSRYPAVDLGSYPFFRADRYGTTLVMRGTDDAELDRMLDDVCAAITACGATPEDIQRG
jgi:molybdopterin-biosynthesis enzyme MoeA-like protein